jgi:hypothetical protein
MARRLVRTEGFEERRARGYLPGRWLERKSTRKSCLICEVAGGVWKNGPPSVGTCMWGVRSAKGGSEGWVSRGVTVGLSLSVSLALGPSSLAGQEFGVFLSQGEVSHQEFLDPAGFGAYLIFDPLPYLRFEGSFTHYDASATRIGEACIYLDPRHDCELENLRSTSDMEGVSLAAIPHFSPAEWIDLGLGGGASFMHLGLEIETESERFVNVLKPTGGQTGAFLVGQVKLTPLPRLPLVLSVGFQTQWVRFSGCSPDPLTYDPYCGTAQVRELRLGVGYRAGG